VQGLVNAFDMPARQSFLITLVDNKEDLANAIALNSSMVNAARLVGPSVAGLIIAAAGEGWCFLLDGFSYLAVIVALLSMRLAPRPARQGPHAPFVQHLNEGVRYAFGFQPIRMVIILLAIVSLVGVPYSVLMPVFAKNVFNGGPHTLGLLMTSSGMGALAGALWLANRKSVVGLGRLIPTATTIFGAALILFSFARVIWLAVPCLMAAGFGFMVQMASSNTLIQTIVDDEKRGRVMSFYMMAFLGTAPFGSLIAGSLSERLGAPHTLLIGGFGCLLGALWFWRKLPALRVAVRPIYVKLGILPEVASGLGNVAELSIPPERQ
jgi:MFS family permease